MSGPPPIDNTNGTSFSELRTAYIAGSQTSAAGDSNLQANLTNTSLSDFVDATFVGSKNVPPPVPSSNISIGTVFKTGSNGNTFT